MHRGKGRARKTKNQRQARKIHLSRRWFLKWRICTLSMDSGFLLNLQRLISIYSWYTDWCYSKYPYTDRIKLSSSTTHQLDVGGAWGVKYPLKRWTNNDVEAPELASSSWWMEAKDTYGFREEIEDRRRDEKRIIRDWGGDFWNWKREWTKLWSFDWFSSHGVFKRDWSKFTISRIAQEMKWRLEMASECANKFTPLASA